MAKIAVLFTCYNRIDKTMNAVKSVLRAYGYLTESQNDAELYWYIVDAGSTDGTIEELKEELGNRAKVQVNQGAYYSQGMRKCMDMVIEDSMQQKYDYVLLINDDVEFYNDFLLRMVDSGRKKTVVVVGATENEGVQTYGGIRYRRLHDSGKKILGLSVAYDMVAYTDVDLSCDTFNANCVMIPGDVFYSCPIIDEMYHHGLGDFDYGLAIRRKGFSIISTDFFVGICAPNSKTGTWMDNALTVRERIDRLNDVKGAPTRLWYYFLKKNFGRLSAMVNALTPYVRIFLHK